MDFDATEGEPATLICPVLTPRHDDSAQIELMAISPVFLDKRARDEASRLTTLTALLALTSAERPPIQQRSRGRA